MTFPKRAFFTSSGDRETGFADMRRRTSLRSSSLRDTKWTLINAHAAVLAGKYRARVKLIMLEDLLAIRGKP